MKTKSEFILSTMIALMFFVVTSASNNGNESSPLDKRLASDIQEKAEIGYDIVEAELGKMKVLLSVEPNKLTYRNFEDEVLTIYKDETGLAVLKKSTGIANVLSLQLEELSFKHNPVSQKIEIEVVTGRSIIHSSGTKTYYSGSVSGSMPISN